MITDKAFHFIWMFFFQMVIMTIFGSNILTYFMPLILGIGKELIDEKIRKGKFDWLDILATVIGGFIAILNYSFITI